MYVYIYLQFIDKLHAAAVFKKEVFLMMAEYSQPKHVGHVKQVCSSWLQINVYIILLGYNDARL
jgi:hypothetical protein